MAEVRPGKFPYNSPERQNPEKVAYYIDERGTCHPRLETNTPRSRPNRKQYGFDGGTSIPNPNAQPYAPDPQPYVPNSRSYAPNPRPYYSNGQSFYPNEQPFATNSQPYVPTQQPFMPTTQHSPHIGVSPNQIHNSFDPSSRPFEPDAQIPPRNSFNSSPMPSWHEHLPPSDFPIADFKEASARTQISDPTHRNYLDGEKLPYQHVRDLGHGSYAVVDEVLDKRVVPSRVRQVFGRNVNRKSFARKVITLPSPASQGLQAQIWSEVSIIKRLAAVRHFVQIVGTYQQRGNFGIVMTPVADMNLKQYMERNPNPNVEDPIYRWFGCLATGLKFLHEQKIKHRDIKPANILIKDGSILYADFGIAKDVKNEATTSTTGWVDAKSPMYCAPEVAEENSRGRLADVFSLGCVFIEMATTLLWFRNVSLDNFSNFRTTEGIRAYHANLQKTLRWLLSLFGLCGSSQAPARPQSQVLERYIGGMHAPICFPLEWSYAMLQPSPNDRITASDLTMLIESVNAWQENQRSKRPMYHEKLHFTQNPAFTGSCCRDSSPEACDGPTLLNVWPTTPPSIVLSQEFMVDWQSANIQYGYNSSPPVIRRRLMNDFKAGGGIPNPVFDTRNLFNGPSRSNAFSYGGR